MDEETMMQASMIEREARQLEDNLQLIDSQIIELENFKISLSYFIKSKEKEMLCCLGKGVYIKSEVEDKGKLFVEVGAGIIIKKSPEDALEVAGQQAERLQNARKEILLRLNQYHAQLQDFISSMNKEQL